MKKTKIEGVCNRDGSQGYSWNPFIGCKNGCHYCWAKRMLARSECPDCRTFAPHWHWERLGQPLTIKKPSTIAVCWQSDLWQYGLPGEIRRVVDLMAGDFCHNYLCLTRDPRAYQHINWMEYLGKALSCHDYPKLFLGATITCQADVNRIGPDFARINHPYKFVSYEPMLGAITNWRPLGNYRWLYMGALTRGGKLCTSPPPGFWVDSAIASARKTGASVYCKSSLGNAGRLPKEQWWQRAGERDNAEG